MRGYNFIYKAFYRSINKFFWYALGHEICGGETDEYNIARVLDNTNKSAKNMAGIIVGGKAWGSLRKHHGGSFETARGED